MARISGRFTKVSDWTRTLPWPYTIEGQSEVHIAGRRGRGVGRLHTSRDLRSVNGPDSNKNPEKLQVGPDRTPTLTIPTRNGNSAPTQVLSLGHPSSACIPIRTQRPNSRHGTARFPHPHVVFGNGNMPRPGHHAMIRTRSALSGDRQDAVRKNPLLQVRRARLRIPSFPVPEKWFLTGGSCCSQQPLPPDIQHSGKREKNGDG